MIFFLCSCITAKHIYHNTVFDKEQSIYFWGMNISKSHTHTHTHTHAPLLIAQFDLKLVSGPGYKGPCQWSSTVYMLYSGVTWSLYWCIVFAPSLQAVLDHLDLYWYPYYSKEYGYKRKPLFWGPDSFEASALFWLHPAPFLHQPLTVVLILRLVTIWSCTHVWEQYRIGLDSLSQIHCCSTVFQSCGYVRRGDR